LDFEGRLHGLLCRRLYLRWIIIFLQGHLKDYVYAVPPRTTDDLVARIQGAVTKVDAEMLRRVRENTVRGTVFDLKMDECRFEYLL
jgi:hypothetical protein